MERKKIVLIGTFDLFHAGHINLIYNANKIGDVFVLVTSDKLNENNVNKERLVLNQIERKLLVESLNLVHNCSILGVTNDPNAELARFISINKISTICYGSDYENNESKKKWANSFGLDYIILPRTNGTSSTYLRRILEK